MKRTVLFVEDDPITAEGLTGVLKREGYEVWLATGLAAARKKFEGSLPDLCIFDVSLPDGSGLDLCREVRESSDKIPILMLTGKKDEGTAVRALTLGATDYLRKPFGAQELVVKIRKLLKDRAEYRIGRLHLDAASRKVEKDGGPIELTRREFEILRALMDHAGDTLTREAILATVSDADESADRTLDSHMSRLRGKLKGAGVDITAVYGVGYRLEEKLPDKARKAG
jgi:DNA-binding response OmpR family regulator